MKPPCLAAPYVALYPGLCDVARANGYALAVHGTLARDMDLIAVPWVDDAQPAEVLVAAIKAHLGALHLREKIIADACLPEDTKTGYENHDPTRKPHLRRAWSFYLGHAYIDLSVMPRVQDAARLLGLGGDVSNPNNLGGVDRPGQVIEASKPLE